MNERPSEGLVRAPAHRSNGEAAATTNGASNLRKSTPEECRERQKFLDRFLDEIKHFEKGASETGKLEEEDGFDAAESLLQLHSDSGPFHTSNMILPPPPYTDQALSVTAPIIATPMAPSISSAQLPDTIDSLAMVLASRQPKVSEAITSSAVSNSSEIPVFSDSDISKILDSVPDSLLDEDAESQNTQHTVKPENEVLDAMALMSSPSKASEFLAAILSEARAEELPKRELHSDLISSNSEATYDLLASISLPNVPPPESSTNFVHISGSEASTSSEGTEMVHLFGHPLQEVKAESLDPKKRFICISDIFQKFFKKLHWDEFKEILGRNNLTPITVNSLEVLSEEDVKELLMRNQARKSGFVKCTALNASGSEQTVIERSETLPGELASGIKTRHGDHSDISYVEIEGCTLPSITYVGRQWVRLADVQGKVLNPTATKEGEMVRF